MNCPDCGAYLGEEDLFCGECGRPIEGAGTPAAPPSPLDVKDQETDILERPAPPPVATRPRPGPVRPRSAQAAPKTPGRSARILALIVALGALLLVCMICSAVFIFRDAADKSTPWPTEEYLSEPTKGIVVEPTFAEPTSEPAVDPGKGGADQGPLLYEEDFADSESGWSIFGEEDTEAGYADGEYRIAVYQADYMAWGNPDPIEEFGDVAVEVDALQAEGPLDNNFGLLYRYRVGEEDDDFYWFQISGDGYYSVDARVSGEWATLVNWEYSDAIHQGVGVTNRLLVACVGEDCSFYVNDVYLTSVTDSLLSGGGVGLATGAFDEAGVVVHFDNLQVYDLEQ